MFFRGPQEERENGEDENTESLFTERNRREIENFSGKLLGFWLLSAFMFTLFLCPLFLANSPQTLKIDTTYYNSEVSFELIYKYNYVSITVFFF